MFPPISSTCDDPRPWFRNQRALGFTTLALPLIILGLCGKRTNGTTVTLEHFAGEFLVGEWLLPSQFGKQSVEHERL